MPIPLIAWIVGGAVTAVVGGVTARSVFTKDEKTNCITTLIQAGVSPADAAERCIGKPEPTLTEKLASPILIFVGIAIAGPPFLTWMRESLEAVIRPRKEERGRSP
ncbi:MAG: hypothetical protein K6T73_01130 [Candidatus Bathyarchaeota archaeon]|nr:hypothetical protein [Candidatus Bathyarchaeota archaeon]